MSETPEQRAARRAARRASETPAERAARHEGYRRMREQKRRARKRRKRITWGGVGLLGVGALVGGGYLMFSGQSSDDPVAEPTVSATSPSPEDRSVRVAFIGDSYTVGAGVSSDAAFPSLLASDLGWEFTNLGQGGTGYIVDADQDPQVARLACGQDYCLNYPEVVGQAAGYDADVVIVSGGRNSADARRAEQKAAIQSFFRELRAALPHADIYAVTPLTDDDPATPMLLAVGDIVERAVESVRGTYLDIGQPLEGKPELVLDDGVHPSEGGHRVIAQAIRQAFEATRDVSGER